MNKNAKIEKILFKFSRDTWRNITNIWTSLTIVFFVIDFFMQHKYSFSTNIISTVYITILGIYASTKEFGRWRNDHKSNYLGELSALLWTIIVVGLIVINTAFDNKYIITDELVTTYVIVMVILAVTVASKSLYYKKNRK